MTYQNVNSAKSVDAGRLWAGGLATAVVAALISVAGIVLARGVFDLAVLAPEGDGAWGDADTGKYAGYAALAALAATGLMHLLILYTPRPARFFGWIMALATLVAVFAPFATDATTASKAATALINLVLGVAIWSLVSGVARSAARQGRHLLGSQQPAPEEPPYGPQYPPTAQ